MHDVQVLAALSVRGGCGAQSHVPYRDSRLTQLLWDGLRCACMCADEVSLPCQSNVRIS